MRKVEKILSETNDGIEHQNETELAQFKTKKRSRKGGGSILRN
jgi:hypothetical protein